jgi:hypothetical protein
MILFHCIKTIKGNGATVLLLEYKTENEVLSFMDDVKYYEKLENQKHKY